MSEYGILELVFNVFSSAVLVLAGVVMCVGVAIGRGLEPLDARTDPRTRFNWW
jgi:hypothetical protein